MTDGHTCGLKLRVNPPGSVYFVAKKVSRSAFALLIAFPTAACKDRSASDTCKPGETREQCIFDQAQKKEEQIQSEQQQSETNETQLPDEAGWSTAEAYLGQISQLFASGMGPQVVAQKAKSWCETSPGSWQESAPAIGDALDESWTCVLRNPPEIGGQSFYLESTAGVVTLSAFDLNDVDSRSLLSMARTRWKNWCASASSFAAMESEPHHHLYRCALEDGTILVIGRFPRDLPQDLWQLSFALYP